jgi:hypothetical protein
MPVAELCDRRFHFRRRQENEAGVGPDPVHKANPSIREAAQP